MMYGLCRWYKNRHSGPSGREKRFSQTRRLGVLDCGYRRLWAHLYRTGSSLMRNALISSLFDLSARI